VNLCVESHFRDAVKNGFEAPTVPDTTVAAGHDALEPAHTNFGFITHETATVAEVTDRLATANATTDSVEAVSTDDGSA
jgi:hypothetical protein